jgi:hypothetical protein
MEIRSSICFAEDLDLHEIRKQSLQPETTTMKNNPNFLTLDAPLS